MSYIPTDPNDPNAPPDDNALYDIDHRNVDDVNGGLFGNDFQDYGGPVAAAAVGGLDDNSTKGRTFGTEPTNLPGGGGVPQDAVVGSYPTPSPDDLLRNSLPGPQNPNPTTPYDYLTNALNANPGPAQHPQTAEGLSFQTANPNGGSFPNPNPGSGLSVEQQAFQSKYPGGGGFNNQGVPTNLPPGSGAPPTSNLPGGSATMGNDPWRAAWEQRIGPYDARFNTADSIRQELQRGGTANWEQAQKMHGVNADIDAIVDAIKRTPDYFQGANTQAWIGQHNNQIQNDINAGVYGKNQAAINNVGGQRVQPLANPIDQYHAEMTQGMRTTLEGWLKDQGATGVHPGFDPYGNATIDWFNRSGQPESLKATFVDLANAIELARQRSAAQQPAAVPAGGGGGGGGYGGRNYPPHGGGGGYGPPAGGGGGGGNPPAKTAADYIVNNGFQNQGGSGVLDEPRYGNALARSGAAQIVNNGFQNQGGSGYLDEPPYGNALAPNSFGENVADAVKNLGGRFLDNNAGIPGAALDFVRGSNNNPGGPPDEWVDENGVRHSTSGGY